MFKSIKFLVLFSALIWTACGKDDPSEENDEELITTVRLTFTPEDGSAPVNFEFKDLDGNGGNSPVITNGLLKKGAHYKAQINFLNETVSPAENITTEISEESDDHQIFLRFSTNLNVDWSYLDNDTKGKPLGLSLHVYTPTTGSGTLIVTLRHQPNKNAAGVDLGDLTNAGGETDVEVTFQVTVQ